MRGGREGESKSWPAGQQAVMSADWKTRDLVVNFTDSN